MENYDCAIAPSAVDNAKTYGIPARNVMLIAEVNSSKENMEILWDI